MMIMRAARGVARLSGAFLATLQAFLAGCVLFLALVVIRGFFDAAWYRAAHGSGRFARIFPRMEFAFVGAHRLRSPNSWFSQAGYVPRHDGVKLFPPVLDYLFLERYWRASDPDPSGQARLEVVTTLVPAPAPPVLAPPAPTPIPAAVTPSAAPPPRDRLEQLWPKVEEDLMALRDVASNLSPSAGFTHKVGSSRRTVAPSRLAMVMQEVMDRFPPQVDHLLVVPWLGIAGGSERVTEAVIRLLREHYGRKRVCIFSPDAVFDTTKSCDDFEIPIVAVNSVAPDLDLEERVAVVDRVLIELAPRTVHNINSHATWVALRRFGQLYVARSRVFVNMYSNFRINELPIGYFWRELPAVIDNVSKVFVDNGVIVAEGERLHGFVPGQRDKHQLVRTPILGMRTNDPRLELRSYRFPGERRSLWMSRIAKEKRLDVLRRIAERCEDRHFAIYGASEGANAVDMSWADDMPNAECHGRFGSFADIPLDTFDSYVFTTEFEGMPISLLEATMLGLPIVAPDVGGIREFIDEDTGWLVSGPEAVDEYVEALDHMHRDPAEAARRVAAAQARLLEGHTWEAFRRTMTSIPGYLH